MRYSNGIKGACIVTKNVGLKIVGQFIEAQVFSRYCESSSTGVGLWANTLPLRRVKSNIYWTSQAVRTGSKYEEFYEL